MGILISAVCLWWLFHSVDLVQMGAVLKRVDVSLVVFAFLTMSCSYLLRGYRWRYFFAGQKPTFFDSYRVMIVGFLMNNVLPARIGELVRAQVGGHVMNSSRAKVLGTIAGERIFDGLTISALFGILYPLTVHANSAQSNALYLVAYGFVAAFLGIIFLLIFWRKVFGLISYLQAKFSRGALSEYALTRVGRFIEGFSSMRNPRRLLALVIMSICIWSIELAVYFQIAAAFEITMSIGALAMFLAVVNFSSLIPAAPGGIGVIEAIATLALVSIGFEREISLAMVATQHLIQIAVVGIPGALCFFHYMNRAPHALEMTEASD